LRHINFEDYRPLIDHGHLHVVSTGIWSEVDVYIICVPTPLSHDRGPDLSYVESAVRSAADYMRPGNLLILESTTYPGTTRTVVKNLLSAFVVGKDIFLAYSPERQDPGNEIYTVENTPKVVGGITAQCATAAAMLYGGLIGHDKIEIVSTTDAAEMVKIFENVYRAVNIALVNEMKMLCDKLGINIWEVINAAATKPFGFQAFYPGPGLGGHCIPIDPFYLTWRARQVGMSTKFIELAGEINTYMPEYVVGKITDALNSDQMCMNSARILVLGVAYKKNVSDTRESPAFKIIELLEERGANVEAADPHVENYQCDIPEKIEWADCVVIVTDHDAFMSPQIIAALEKAVVVDTRNFLRAGTGAVRA